MKLTFIGKKTSSVPDQSRGVHAVPQERWNNEFLFLQAVGIISVVLSHSEQNIPVFFSSVFPYSSWHMPFFVFISGYFFHPESSYGQFCRKKAHRLLLPALLINLLYGILILVARQSGLVAYGRDISLETLFLQPFFGGDQFMVNTSMWFIFQLFILQMIFGALKLIRGKYVDHILLLGTLLLSVFALY